MFIKKDFDDITVQVFEEKYRDALNQFELSERQQIYSSLPQTVLDDALKDENRIANVALNKEGKVVGSSFCIVIINMKVMIHQTMLFMYVHCQLMKSFKAMDMGQK